MGKSLALLRESDMRLPELPHRAATPGCGLPWEYGFVCMVSCTMMSSCVGPSFGVAHAVVQAKNPTYQYSICSLPAANPSVASYEVQVDRATSRWGMLILHRTFRNDSSGELLAGLNAFEVSQLRYSGSAKNLPADVNTIKLSAERIVFRAVGCTGVQTRYRGDNWGSSGTDDDPISASASLRSMSSYSGEITFLLPPSD